MHMLALRFSPFQGHWEKELHVHTSKVFLVTIFYAFSPSQPTNLEPLNFYSGLPGRNMPCDLHMEHFKPDL